ncbi:hypothetical protein RDI58_007372 [Solanum bulbocastanum]|uniref:Uncharacterized protein n=1 Tax=Solanum bulbocastanum TaxID=147425 RepID=A0AAN8TUU4_SOLBU
MVTEIWEVLTRLERMAIEMANVAARQNQLEALNEKSFSEPKKAIEDGHGKQPATLRFSEEIYSPIIGPLGIPGIMNSVPSPPLFNRTTTSNPICGGHLPIKRSQSLLARIRFILPNLTLLHPNNFSSLRDSHCPKVPNCRLPSIPILSTTLHI